MATKNTKSTYANRGKEFEDKIIKKCNQYRKENRAFIIKTYPEIILVRKMGKVVNAVFRDKSILDFVGVLSSGQTLFIEAKSHTNKNSFALANIKPHQIVTAKEMLKYTYLCFYIIYFKSLDRTFVIHTSQVEDFMNNNERKSIPLKWLEKNTIEIDSDNLDFLSVVENYS